MTNAAIVEYKNKRDAQAVLNMNNDGLKDAVHHFTMETIKANYSKNYTWMGIPILQYPSDLTVMQELIWEIRPEVIIETGVAFGGMLVFYASILECIGGKGIVLGIDIDPREHNMQELEKHPLRNRISVAKGSSIDQHIVDAAKYFIRDHSRVLISLDSNHTHEHVLKELELYAPLVSVGSYIIVFDTAIDRYNQYSPEHTERPWGNGNNPASAVREFLRNNDDFVVDNLVETRALVTSAPGGWLRRVKR